MARKNSHKRRSSRHRSRNYRGGAGAAEYMLSTVGDENTQFRNVMDNSSQSNVIVPLRGGKSRRKKRGGFFGSIINQAIVPLSLLTMQQTYRKKSHGGTRRRRR